MLLELAIRNFAIIEDLSIRLDRGLTILSGETGAGKSILINAVNLLLGARATTALIRTGADSAELEALFEISTDTPLARTMIQSGYDPGEGLQVRRVISHNERHRLYINGRLATMQALNDLTAHLASISGQHAHQGLLKEEEHLAILDQFGALTTLKDQYLREYQELLPLIGKEQALLKQRTRQDEQLALLQFQQQEIDQAAPIEGEDETLEKERRRLKNSETLLQVVGDCVDRLYNQNNAVTALLFQMGKELARVGEIDDQLAPMSQELDTLAYGAEDLAANLTRYLKQIDLDPRRLETVEARLDLLNRLKRKYGGSLTAVIDFGQDIGRRLNDIDNMDERLSQVRRALKARHLQLADLAQTLSTKRQQAAKQLARAVESQLGDLKMDGTIFFVELQTLDAGQETSPHLISEARYLSPTGWDRATFMIAPNVGETAKPLAAIASGGELSRVVLALKAIQANSDALETIATIVFDEVDAGIGGSVADLVGRKLAGLAQRHQVLCITHLPQIAGYGEHHFRIEKIVSQGRTHTTITPLSPDERIMEIARMLGGEKITPATLAHAREMLDYCKTTLGGEDGHLKTIEIAESSSRE